MQNAAYNGTDLMPLSNPKFLVDTLMAMGGEYLETNS
jgi:hypothetical protein